MKKAKVIRTKEELKIGALKAGEVHRFHVQLSDNSLGVPWRVPLIIIKGRKKGPVVGLTAALHGDELNGISMIFKLIQEIDPEELHGTLVMAPIVNVPAYLTNQRYFTDHVDLNRIVPGRPDGSASDVYIYAFTRKIVRKLDYLLDLHTASRGRVNSLYIRADLSKKECRDLAYLQNPQIIVNKPDEEATLRGWANGQGIHSITVEIGNPNAFQPELVDDTMPGVLNTLKYLKMIPGKVEDMISDAIVCDESYWIYSRKGGIVEVPPALADKVRKGDTIAVIYDVFGRPIEHIEADRSGIVIGKNVSPNCDAGARILHLGVSLFEPEEGNIPANQDD